MHEQPRLQRPRAARLPFDAARWDADPSTIYVLTPDLRISFVNRAWYRFAEANGARWSSGQWGVGTRIMDAVPAVLRPFYEHLFDVALTTREIEHDYECSSVTTFRRFRMRVAPCEPGSLLVVNTCLQDAPYPAPGPPSSSAIYRGAAGEVVQCSHCRRVRRADHRPRAPSWEWVPVYVDRPAPGTSHALCELCREHYYPPV